MVELARAKVRAKLGDLPDPTPIWAYRLIIRTVLVELNREDS